MSYQAEERYWTDYLRIALPIAGLLLLLSVFWYWASSFIGDDDEDPPRTPAAAVINTPITAATLTPTVGQAINLTPVTVDPTQAAAPPPTEGAQPAEPTATTAPAEDTTTDGGTTGSFAEGDLVVVNDIDVNMRAEPSLTGEVVETLTEGTELRILSAESVDDGEYVWWNVEDEANVLQGWVAEDFLSAA